MEMRLKLTTGIVLTILLFCVLTTDIPVSSVVSDDVPSGFPAKMRAREAVTQLSTKIGVIGPVGLPYWSPAGMKEGAEMARDEINAMGGIAFPEGNVTITLCLGNEYAVPAPDPVAARAEVSRLISVEDCDIIMGGFRTETTAAMIEEAMDYQVPFIINGAATNELISDTVPVNYSRYKYLFRTNPTNSTTLAMALCNFIQSVLEFKLLLLYGEYLWGGAPNPQVKVAVVSENLIEWDEMYVGMTNPAIYPSVLGSYANVTYSTRVSVNETDFSAVLDGVNASEARLLIHLFSTQAGFNFINQWEESGVEALPVGINLCAQMQDHWDNTLGKCEYETTISFGGTRTPITPQAVAFSDNFFAKNGTWPTYTALGAYDTIYWLKHFVETTGISYANFTDPDKFADDFEDAPERTGLAGKFKFTSDHDVFCNEIGENWGEDYVRPFVCQWQKSSITGEARLEVVSPRYDRAVSFAKKWKIPTWAYSLAETDLNWDGIVDVYDLILCAIHFGTKAGDPNWNLEVDVDGNGIVDIADISRVVNYFGMSEYEELVGMASPIPRTTQTNSKTTVFLDPPTINGTAIGLNNTVTVNLNIRDAVDIYSWQAGLTFNATLLECTAFVIGEFLQIGAWSATSGSVNNTSGEITPHACTLWYENSASGDGRLAYATFKVKELGVSDLHLRDVKVIDAHYVNMSKMVPFDIIDVYTVTRSATQTVFTVSNSTGVEPNGFEFDDEDKPVLVVHGSGFYDHAFSHPDNEVSFNVTGPYSGFSNVSIPKTLLNVSTSDKVLVIIDDIPLKTEERAVTENTTHFFVYFNYTLGTHNIRSLKRPPVHNIDANRYYATIQEAINVATPRDKILVYAGNHYENVVLNKTVTLTGENKDNTTIDGSGTGTVINVTANNVTINGFTIQNSGNPKCGILLDGSSGNNISSNILTNNYYGISLVNSNNNTLDSNNVNSNELSGISLDGSDSNALNGNILTNNGGGLILKFSGDNTLTDNNMTDNNWSFAVSGGSISDFGNNIDTSNLVDGKSVRYLVNQSDLTIDPFTFPDVGYLGIVNSENVTVKDLNLTKNGQGVLFAFTNLSSIENVNVSKNWVGIQFWESDINTVYNNTISNNSIGIIIDSSDGNTIYHNNFISNQIQADTFESYSNVWDNGYPSGGNYWSDHSITYPFVMDEYKGVNQNVQGNDGIIDDLKVIDEENKDNYPLVSPLTPSIYNLNTHQGYATIQQAINALQTSNGHVIIVRGGTYSEQVTINKTLTLIGIIGSTVINGTGTVVNITANHVTLRGFTIQGSGSTDKGILLSYANNVVIHENTIKKKGYGIWLDHSDNCSVSGNTINNNTDEGIHLESSGGTIISRNTLSNNSVGIVLSFSSGNDIHRNNVTYNDVGIDLWWSSSNTIYHNSFINNTNQVDSRYSTNTWDDEYPSGGNYWSDYEEIYPNATELDDSGIWDTPYTIEGDNPDNYPLIGPKIPQHAVAVASVAPSKTVIGQGYSLSITVTLENQGHYTEKFNVTAYYNDTAITVTNGKNYTTITLTGEDYTTITFTLNTTGVPYGNYTLSAYATPIPGETNTTDNTHIDGLVLVSVVGDVNGDCIADGGDQISVGWNLWWSLPHPEYYNPNADVNGDGACDGGDQITVGNHLWESWP